MIQIFGISTWLTSTLRSYQAKTPTRTADYDSSILNCSPTRQLTFPTLSSEKPTATLGDAEADAASEHDDAMQFEEHADEQRSKPHASLRVLALCHSAMIADLWTLASHLARYRISACAGCVAPLALCRSAIIPDPTTAGLMLALCWLARCHSLRSSWDVLLLMMPACWRRPSKAWPDDIVLCCWRAGGL